MKTAVSLPDDLFQAADVTPVALDRRTLVKRVRARGLHPLLQKVSRFPV